MRNQIHRKQNSSRREKHKAQAEMSKLQHDIAAKHRKAHGPTPAEQLAILDFRLGVGVGAKRERARLYKQIEASK